MNLLNLGGVKKAGKSQPTPAKSPVSHGVSGSSKKRAPDDAETALQHTAFLDTVAEQFPRYSHSRHVRLLNRTTV